MVFHHYNQTINNFSHASGAGIGILAVIVVVLTIFMIRYRRMHASLKVISNNNSAENPIMSELACSHVYFEVPIFQNKELEEATKNFDSSQELGQGGFGTVYYGKNKSTYPPSKLEISYRS